MRGMGDSTSMQGTADVRGAVSGLTAERRRSLLGEYHAMTSGRLEVEDLIQAASGFEGQRLRQHWRLYAERASALRQEYVAGVPVLAVARCPFTAQVLEHSIDPFDLDGLWWDHEAPARPLEHLPATFFGLAGAVRLAEPVAVAPFLCKPGPEVPYVVLRVLQHQAVRAVLASVPVGRHQGYAIAYFASPMPGDLPRVNTWGSGEYGLVGPDGQWIWESEPENEGEFDYDLAPWISSGKLRWIAPGDAQLALRDAVEGCPYLGLPGRRSITRIQEGRVWWSQRPEGGHFP